MTATEPDPTPPAFHVMQQIETTVVNAVGTVERVMRVTFTAPDGITGTVNIPVSGYSVDVARKAILAKLAVLQGVASLNR